MRVAHWLALLLGTLAALGASDLDLPVRKPTRLEPSPSVAPQPPRRLTPPPESPRPVVFWGEELAPARRVAYVLDYSSSMTPSRWAGMRREFARSVRNLDGAEFIALLYGCSVEPYSDEYSTDAEGAIAWLESHEPPWLTRNATGTAQAVLYALQSGAQIVILLTDGAPGGCGLAVPGRPPYETHARVIRERNRQPVPVFCFVWPVDQDAERFGHMVAADSGGVLFLVR